MKKRQIIKHKFLYSIQEYVDVFHSKIIVDGECWSWSGYATRNVPVLIYKNTRVPAVAISFYLKTGKINKTPNISRSCEYSGCLNPDHIYDRNKKRICKMCGNILPISSFTKRSNSVYFRGWCKKCESKKAALWHKNNPEKSYALSRKTSLKHYHGFSQDEYNNISKSQNGACSICKQKPKNDTLYIDHNHKTGKIRGLLCNNCNRGIGLLGDSIENLEEAINYLKKNGSYGGSSEK